MDGAAFIEAFREETMDEAEPFLWSDTLILRYLDEAQTAFCRETEGLEARVVATVFAESGAAALDPKILKVRAAHLESSGAPLELVSVEEAREAHFVVGVTPLGTPRTLVLGAPARGRMQVFPRPAQDTRIVLDVFRLPLERIEAPGDELEVGDAHAPDLMHYALYRAYSRPDPDTMDRVRADYFREQFDLAVLRARREQGRRRKPNGATQFSW